MTEVQSTLSMIGTMLVLFIYQGTRVDKLRSDVTQRIDKLGDLLVGHMTDRNIHNG